MRHMGLFTGEYRYRHVHGTQSKRATSERATFPSQRPDNNTETCRTLEMCICQPVQTALIKKQRNVQASRGAPLMIDISREPRESSVRARPTRREREKNRRFDERAGPFPPPPLPVYPRFVYPPSIHFAREGLAEHDPPRGEIRKKRTFAGGGG